MEKNLKSGKCARIVRDCMFINECWDSDRSEAIAQLYTLEGSLINDNFKQYIPVAKELLIVEAWATIEEKVMMKRSFLGMIDTFLQALELSLAVDTIEEHRQKAIGIIDSMATNAKVLLTEATNEELQANCAEVITIVTAFKEICKIGTAIGKRIEVKNI